MLRIIFIILVLNSVHAEPWDDVTWHNLLHYEKTTFGLRSSVKTKEFFIAEDGYKNPKNEFIKFKEQINNPEVRCKFIARTRFVAEQSGIVFDPYTECKAFSEWFSLINPKGVTLIFPSVYLNNPASAFGHTLIRLDSDDPEIVRYSVNFSAQTNGESSLLYAFKGVFGGYDGRFAVAPYYNLVKKYNDYESRDIWEYKLDFTLEETRKLVEHLWELQEIDFSYYYFDENCSYHLLSLLDVARSELDLISKFSIWVLPLDTVQEMSKIIQSAKLRTAITEDIFNREKEVKDITLIKNYVKTGNLDLINEPKSLILLQDYLSYLTTKGKITEEKSRELSYKLYQKISDSKESDKIEIIKEDPRKHHKFNKFTLDAFNQQIEYKPSYHGLLDPLEGTSKFSAVDLLKIRLDHKLRTKRFDLIEIYSLSPRGDLIKPLSYKLNLFYEDHKLSSKVIDFGMGFTNQFDNLLVYSLAKTTPTFLTYKDDSFFLGLGNETGLILDDKFGRTLAKYNVLSYLTGDSLRQFSVNRTIPVNNNFQFNLGYSKSYNFDVRDEIISINIDTFF